MKNLSPPSDEELHAYVDGELSRDRQQQVEAFLESDPESYERVRQWRRAAQMLRMDLFHAVTENPDPLLDLTRVKTNVRERSRARILALAVLASVFVSATSGGWLLRGYQGAPVPMADAVEAYRVFASDANRPVELGAAESVKLQRWLSKRLGRSVTFPDLHEDGFDLLGGRLLSTPEGPAALVFYQDQEGERVSLYVRSSEHFPPGTKGTRQDGNLLARYWYENGYGFAVVSSANDARSAALQDVIQSRM
jgi:anti-sigma factor RsiW